MELVDSQDAVDLGEQSLQEAEAIAGDAGDGRDGLGVGEVVGIEFGSELAPVPGQDEGQSSPDSGR